MTIAILVALLLAGCGPRYTIYNGGLPYTNSATLHSATALAPTEAGVIFSTDYAPASESRTYAGPTNRVAVSVPETAARREFVSLSTSSGVHGMAVTNPADLAASDMQVKSASGVAPSRLLVTREGPDTMYVPGHGLALGEVGATSSETASGSTGAMARSGHVETAGLSAGPASASAAGHLQGIGDSDMAVAGSQAVQVLAMDEPRRPTLYAGTSAPRLESWAGSPQQASDTRTTKAHLHESTARELATATQPVGVAVAPGLDAYQASAGTQVITAPGGLQPLSSEKAARVLAASYSAPGIGNAQHVIVASGSQGALLYARHFMTARLVNAEGLEERRTTGGAASTTDAGFVQGIADAVQAARADQSAGAMEVSTERSTTSMTTLRGLRTSEWTSMAQAATAVSPPNLFVMKEARLVDEAGVRRLMSAGVIRDEPRSASVIVYRLHVFNAGNATAKDVFVLDRLDPAMEILINSMSTNSDDATATYYLESRSLEVVLPRLEAGGYFVVEFFTELP